MSPDPPRRGPQALVVESGAPLAALTTLGLGGPARHLATLHDEREVMEALDWADQRGEPVAVLGGGSNLVVADTGFDGLVVRMALRGARVARTATEARLTAAAGEPWDQLVALAVDEGWAGLECLSGIPGLVGAAPIQNVGAYGQEVAETIAAVRVVDRSTRSIHELTPLECRFAYRDSAFKQDAGRLIVLAVTFRLRPGGAPSVRYPELSRALGARAASAGLADVREAVLGLRRAKSMVLERDGENRHSVGSFFVNPVLSEEQADAVARRALAAGDVASADELPRFPAPDGRVKLSAAWLVEHAGFARGTRRGHVGVSSRHALALVHHGGGTTAELIALARSVRDAVMRRFAVRLRPEPSFLGFARPDPLDD
ncbi:MAG: UDP-N-acetylmuramate dehydrogenase [Acidobacteriota bacterium]